MDLYWLCGVNVMVDVNTVIGPLVNEFRAGYNFRFKVFRAGQTSLVFLRLRDWAYRESIGTDNIHGHRTLKAPHPVRSAQLTRVPPS